MTKKEERSEYALKTVERICDAFENIYLVDEKSRNNNLSYAIHVYETLIPEHEISRAAVDLLLENLARYLSDQRIDFKLAENIYRDLIQSRDETF